MKRPEFRTRPALSMTVLLVVVNLAVFVLQEVNRAYGNFSEYQYFALSKLGLSKGYIWQLLTFQFLHFSGWHFVMNMIGLYLFGRPVEDSLGRKHFCFLYFGSGVVGGLLQSFLGLFLPTVFAIPVVGASAGVFGLIAAFARLDPDREILVFFILPMRAKHFLWVAGAVAVFYVLVPADPGIAHAAHLGGIVGGIAYVHWIIQSPVSFWAWRPMRPRRRPQQLVKVRAPKVAPWQRSKESGTDELPPSEFISREVDPILDKISEHGIQSLTPRERQILQAARDKMEKRSRRP
jgi:membrane associated rhomboid family serine protease